MATNQSAFVSILSLVSLFLVNQLKAQQGLGCGHTRCPNAGQVRINIITDTHGNYLGGCNCACDPSLSDPQSASYCVPPNVINFDANSGLGDCACQVPSLQFPSIPQVNLPASPITVICDTIGTCSCPIGHAGECKIICDGTVDACKDSLLECNNDGYPCFVECIAENSCSGSSSIMGPANAALTVNCLGEKSCEGDTYFNGETGTDLSVICDGTTSCKDAQFNCGRGVSTVFCNGYPDACNDAVFNLLPHASTMAGAQFSCVGRQCPSNVPQSFSNVLTEPTGAPTNRPTGAPTQRPTVMVTRCADHGDCSCSPGLPEPCRIICDGTTDACKDGVISCNSAGFDCVVDCIAPESCAGSSTIMGPIGASLTVNCIGQKACQGATRIDGAQGTDLTINCAGDDACKGSGVIFNFGNGIGKVSCSGSPDSCVDAVFILAPRAASTPGMAFSCVGANCPAELAAFNNVPSNIIPIPAPVNPVPVPVPIPAPPTKQPTNQIPVVIIKSSYCCRTKLANFLPFRGYCWSETTEAGCVAVPSHRCVWDAANCLPDPPVNTYPSMVNTPCRFTHVACNGNNQCCSETCTADNMCR